MPKQSDSHEEQKNLTAIQNNFNINTNVNIEALSKLATVSPELANRVMTIYETQLEAAKEIDNRILTLEERNKALEESETPFIRKYAYRGQLMAFFTAFGGLGSALFFGAIDMEKAAIVSISVAIGVLAVQFLGKQKKA